VLGTARGALTKSIDFNDVESRTVDKRTARTQVKTKAQRLWHEAAEASELDFNAYHPMPRGLFGDNRHNASGDADFVHVSTLAGSAESNQKAAMLTSNGIPPIRNS
jgi:hypothetical protein